MNGAPDNPKWILQCRDLVQLYYGVRMVASIIEGQPFFTPNLPKQILQQDPRRIRYEIILANSDAATQIAGLGSTDDIAFNTGQLYQVAPGASMVIERSFLSDLDAVTIPLSAFVTSANLVISTRETYLTPLPADES
jgi:hypothetical protein